MTEETKAGIHVTLEHAKSIGTSILVLGGILWGAVSAAGWTGQPAVTLTITRNTMEDGRFLEETRWTFYEQRDLRASVEDGIVPVQTVRTP